MGCVWHPEYPHEVSSSSSKGYQRGHARHRKPPLWRRAARGAVPFFTAPRTRWPLRQNPGKLEPIVRGR
jgi:hypothetical protein